MYESKRLEYIQMFYIIGSYFVIDGNLDLENSVRDLLVKKYCILQIIVYAGRNDSLQHQHTIFS